MVRDGPAQALLVAQRIDVPGPVTVEEAHRIPSEVRRDLAVRTDERDDPVGVPAAPGAQLPVEQHSRCSTDRAHVRPGQGRDDDHLFGVGRSVDRRDRPHSSVHVQAAVDAVRGQQPRHRGRGGDQVGKGVATAVEDVAASGAQAHRRDRHQRIHPGSCAWSRLCWSALCYSCGSPVFAYDHKDCTWPACTATAAE